ncbi:MAG: ATP-binding protein [Ignavibacteria bacterium]
MVQIVIIIAALAAGCSQSQLKGLLEQHQQDLAASNCADTSQWRAIADLRGRVIELNDPHCDSLYNMLVLRITEAAEQSRHDLGQYVITLRGGLPLTGSLDMGLAHDLRYWGNHNAARSQYARLATASSMTSSNALANLGMEYERVGRLRAALRYTLAADSMFVSESSLRGRIWTQRILYSTYMKLGLRDMALGCLSTYRRAHDEHERIAPWQMADTITDLNLVHAIHQFSYVQEDLERAFGRHTDSYLQLYRSNRSTSPTWMNSWITSNPLLGPLPKPVIRSFPADGTFLAWTDSLVNSADGQLARATRFGTFALAGDRWFLVHPARGETATQSITAREAITSDTLYASSGIRGVYPLGNDSLLAVTSDSLIVLHAGKNARIVLPKELRSSVSDMDILALGSNAILVLNGSMLLHLDRTSLRVTASLDLRAPNVQVLPVGRSNRSAAILPVTNEVVLVKAHSSAAIVAVRVSDSPHQLTALHLSERNGEGRSTFLTAYQDGNIFQRSFWFAAADTLCVSRQKAITHGATSTREESIFPMQINAPRPLVVLRQFDNLDIIDTATKTVWPQFAVPIPFDEKQGGVLGVYRDSARKLRCLYHDGYAVISIPLSNTSYNWTPELITITEYDKDQHVIKSLRDILEHTLNGDLVSRVAARSSMITSCFPVLYRSHERADAIWNTSESRMFWHVRVNPAQFAQGIDVSLPMQSAPYHVSFSHSPLNAPWSYALVTLASGALLGVWGVRTLRRRRQRQQETITAAKSQQLELLREDMHDMIGSRLVRIASLARQASPENNEEVLARIHDMTIVTVRSLRNLLTLMSESTMTDQDFYGSMREYVMESCKDARIECSIDINVDDSTSLDNAGRHELLMIISELLTNTIRHASATHVNFSINTDALITTITWSDNGTGIDPLAKRGNGLHNIERRAKRIKALVAVDTAPDSGTRYSISFSNTQGTRS